MDSKQIGKWGENIACYYLKNNGYRILDRNYTLKWRQGPLKGEIDIVAKKDNIISFVEVKTLQQSPVRMGEAPALKERGSTPWERRPAISGAAGQAGGSCFLPEDKVNFAKQKQLIKICQNWLAEKNIPLDSRWQIDVVSLVLERDNKAKVRHFKNIAS